MAGPPCHYAGPLLLDHFVMRTCRKAGPPCQSCRSSSQSDQVTRTAGGPPSAVLYYLISSCDGDLRNGRKAGLPCQSVVVTGPKAVRRQMAGPSPNSPSQHRPTKLQVRPASLQVQISESKQYNLGPAIWQVVNRLVEHDKKYHAHLTNNSNLDRAIDVINNKLSNGMDKLLASWIGKFFEIKTVQFYGGFIHHLLLHQVECDDKYVMEFDFNGIGARFDRKCFAMITGLNCGKFPHDSELDHLPYNLWTKFFGKRGPMTQGEFSKAFEDLDFDEKEVADNVKCCMFYFLEMMLLGGDKKRLIWGFETIPIVATIGPRGKYHGSNWIPRMLAWSCPSILQYTKLATTIFDRKDYTVKNKLRPTKEELQQTYMKTFWHRPSDRKYYGPPVFRVEASKSQLLASQLPIDDMKDASLKIPTYSRLEMQIEEIRS
ncbi:hypothetical protein FNV43_RR04329 [Rhamnella rubrinervis]|uniref:DUF1985 domain-containing protein n=1 Tax=Rhamnella rubrinervis TaxID=2594499 RepID=A0A8K0HKT7_9ROSA|nr:hypothetical protein FNV43_RR04329 [Rhamnella rubrinervis]